MQQRIGVSRRITRLLAIGLVGFHLLTGVLGTLPSFQQQSVHVVLALALVFLLYPPRKTTGNSTAARLADWLLIALLVLQGAYIFLTYRTFFPFMVRDINTFEVVLALVAAAVIVESARRTTGWVFPTLVIAAFLYTVVGEIIPGYWGHPQMSLASITSHLYLSSQGIWGYMVHLSATYLVLFLIFGSFLLSTGGSDTIINFAKVIAGRFRGGPAKVAVVSSGFFGSICGSGMANVAATGAFTIPMMKKLGYSREFAGGVESAASTGGQVMPPIMGAAGFIMAELLGVPYLTVMVAALLPALLFYLAVFMGVHFQALKLDLRPIPAEELPSLKTVLAPSRLGVVLVPVGVLLYLLISGYSLTMVATSACISVLVTYVLCEPSPDKIKQKFWSMPDVLEKAGTSVLVMVPVLASANILLFFLDFTGLTIKFSSSLMSLGGSHWFMVLALTGILVMMLGTGLPITASYVLGVTVAGSALVYIGIVPLAAHLFILYYSILANLTPPVCAAVYVAAAIAEANWLRTAWAAVKLAPLLYLIPFVFVFEPAFLMRGGAGLIVASVGGAAIGAILLSSGAMGHMVMKCRTWERLGLVAAGVALLLPGLRTDLVGFAVAIPIVGWQLWRRKAEVASVREDNAGQRK
jgi:TRAP transporter 4TM/12TM fusion protein